VKTILLTSVIALTACATQISGKAYDQGWRRVQVHELMTTNTAATRVDKDCRPQLASAGYTRFALVSYSFGGNPNLRNKMVVAIPNDLVLKGADQAFGNTQDCQLPLRLTEPL
jgi:hypothetical protein